MVSAVSWKGLEMLPDRKLKDEQIADLTKWVQIGAPWGRDWGGDPKEYPLRLEQVAHRAKSFAARIQRADVLAVIATIRTKQGTDR